MITSDQNGKFEDWKTDKGGLSLNIKIAIVGAFSSSNKVVYGGVATTCKRLMESSFPKKTDVYEIDSTQKSNPPPNRFSRLCFAYKRMVEYIGTIEKVHPDVVIIFVSSGLGSVIEKGCMAWYARFRKTPSFLFPRGGALIEKCEKSKAFLMVVKIFFKGGKRILCQGKNWESFFVYILKWDSRKTHIVRNWTATEKLLEIGKNRIYSNLERPIKLLFLGWLEKKKGIFELLKVCKNLNEIGEVDFILYIAGDGKARKYAKEFVNLWNLTERVKFLGWVECEKIENLLKEVNVLVHPSWDEGFPNAIIEAMSAGVAVIATKVGTIPDYLRNKEDALLIKRKDTEALQTAIEKLYRSPDLLQGIAERGHKFAAKNFNMQQGSERLLEIVRLETNK